jgi:glutamate racemase
MKIGIFDSGLGGLIITHSLTHYLPEYDYLYLGDTARVPYGDLSQEVVYRYTLQAVDYLFAQDCSLIIIACNTASAEALRRIQQEYLPLHHPQKRVLGVLIPAAEAAVEATKTRHIGILATRSTTASGAFYRELMKLEPDLSISELATPSLVPLIERGEIEAASLALMTYIRTLPAIDTLILGCTHYPLLKLAARAALGAGVTVISQDEIMPAKVRSYLAAHPEIETTLTRSSRYEFVVTSFTKEAARLAARLYSQDIDLRVVTLPGD